MNKKDVPTFCSSKFCSMNEMLFSVKKDFFYLKNEWEKNQIKKQILELSNTINSSSHNEAQG